MELKLARISFPALATEGVLYIDDAFECHTLEPPCGDYGKGYAVAPGRYRITLEHSDYFGREIPTLAVKGRSGIRIHTGNGGRGTEGSIVVGREQSTVADAWAGRNVRPYMTLLVRIKAAIRRQEEVWLTVLEARRNQ